MTIETNPLLEIKKPTLALIKEASDTHLLEAYISKPSTMQKSWFAAELNRRGIAPATAVAEVLNGTPIADVVKNKTTQRPVNTLSLTEIKETINDVPNQVKEIVDDIKEEFTKALHSSQKKQDMVAGRKKYKGAMDAVINAPDLEDLIDPTVNLTENQKNFLESWVKNGGNISKALRDAKVSPSNFRRYKPLLKSPAGRLYIQKIKEKGFDEAALTVSEIINKFRKTYEKALGDGDYKAANEAAAMLGKYMGMFVDKSESTNRVVTHVTGDKPQEVKNDIVYFEDIVKKAAKNLKNRNLKVALANENE